MLCLQSPAAHTGNMFSPSLSGTGSSHGHQPAEVFRKDLISAMKLPDSHPLQPDDYMVITDSWKQEWEKGVQVPVSPDNIPNICCHALCPSEQGTFKMPRKNICMSEGMPEQTDYAAALNKKLESVCMYDLDEVDEQWLDIVNQERKDMNDTPIDEFTVEHIIEECEMQCHKNMEHAMQTEEGLGIEYDDDVICDVCRAPDCEEGNEMVFCDKCDICVHQACYGIVKVPEGSWMCRTCALGIQPLCLLCGKKGGAMKSTRSGTKWAHVSCALWIPEVSIGCVERMEPITKISQIPGSRWALICNLCRIRTGACIQCSVKTCKVAYHVTCGFQQGLEMKTFLDEEVEVRFKSFCLKHSKKRNAESDTDATPQKPPSASGTPKKEKSIEEKDNERAIRIQNITEDFYKYAKAKEVATNLGMKDDLETVDLVFEYWKLKRKSGFNKPLVILQKEELPSDSEEYNLHARMRMFVHLRQDLERVRNLCYMVQKREKLSRQMASLREDIFRKQETIFSGEEALRLSPEELAFAREAAALSSAVPAKPRPHYDLFSVEVFPEVAGAEDRGGAAVEGKDTLGGGLAAVRSRAARARERRSPLSSSSSTSSSSETESYLESRCSSRTETSKSSEPADGKLALAASLAGLDSQAAPGDVSIPGELEDGGVSRPGCEPRPARDVLPAEPARLPPSPQSENSRLVRPIERRTTPLKRTSSDSPDGGGGADGIKTKRRSRNGRLSHAAAAKITGYFKSARSDSAPKPEPKTAAAAGREVPAPARQPRQTLSPRLLQMKEEAARLSERMFASSPASRAILSGYRIPKKKSIPTSESSSSPPAVMEGDTASAAAFLHRSPKDGGGRPHPSPVAVATATPETRSARRRIEDELDRGHAAAGGDRQFENIDSEVSICRKSKGSSSPLPSLCDSEDDIIIVDDDDSGERRQQQQQLTKQLMSHAGFGGPTAKLTRSHSVDASEVNNRVDENKPVTARIYDAAYRLLNSAIPL